MATRQWTWVVATWLIVGLAGAATGQEKTPAEPPKTLWQELAWFAYVENSYVVNLRGEATKGSNELRFYDVDRGCTFNMAEFSVKKDPSERYPFGFGLVLTGGEDARFNTPSGSSAAPAIRRRTRRRWTSRKPTSRTRSRSGRG